MPHCRTEEPSEKKDEDLELMMASDCEGPFCWPGFLVLPLYKTSTIWLIDDLPKQYIFYVVSVSSFLVETRNDGFVLTTSEWV